MLSELVEHEPDSKTKVLLLLAEVDAIARIGLVTLGVCAESMSIPECKQEESRERVNGALSKVNDALRRALQNATSSLSTFVPASTSAQPTPGVEDVVAFINQTVRVVLSRAKGGLDARGWAGREVLHEKIVNETTEKLRNYTSSYVFNALALLPDDRDSRQRCQLLEDRVVDVGYTNLNFFVFYANASSKETAEEAWDKLKNETDFRDVVLDHVFAHSSGSLCERLTSVLEDRKIDKDNFGGGIAAVKCGYEFVWYELGYTYFYAAFSSTGYKWELKGGAYDPKCGQIFFFP